MLTVALYGSSLVLSSIGAALAAQPGIHVHAVNTIDPGPERLPDELGADVVVFDMAVLAPETFALWRASPDVLLIGVDIASDMAIVFSREFTHVGTTSELVQVIRTHAPRGRGLLATAPSPADGFN
jgi:hypothetical protein